ncbi:MAG: hypothetical protein ACJ74H_02025 [Thermoanaerobaculia bacterium]
MIAQAGRKSTARETHQCMQCAACFEIVNGRGDDERRLLHHGLQQMREKKNGGAALGVDLVGADERRERFKSLLWRLCITPWRRKRALAAEVQARIEAARQGRSLPYARMRKIRGAMIVCACRRQPRDEEMFSRRENGPPLQPVVQPLMVARIGIQREPRRGHREQFRVVQLAVHVHVLLAMQNRTSRTFADAGSRLASVDGMGRRKRRTHVSGPLHQRVLALTEREQER